MAQGNDLRSPMIALAVLGLAIGGVTSARAVGGTKPSEATTVNLGQVYFGGSSRPSDPVSRNGELWRLPSLLAQDVVTVAGQSDNGTYNEEICLAGGVDDYSFTDNWCNNSESQYLTPQGRRVTLVAGRDASDSFLELHPINSAYHFTVESIQHALGLGLPAVQSVKRKGSVRATATLTNGAPVPDGLDVALIIRQGPSKWVRVSRAYGGQLTFKLKLPKSARGKAKLSLSRGADAQYLAATAKATKTRIT